MNFDLEANVLSWELGKGKISKVIEMGNFLVHVSPAGKPVLIEILNASNFKTKLSRLETIRQISEAI